MTEELLGPMADALDPELVAPVVVYLASDQCDVTGQILSVAGGRVSRVVVAEPLGYYSKELTPEQVRDNWGTIRSEEHTSELQSLMRISYAVFCLKKKKNNRKN